VLTGCTDSSWFEVVAAKGFNETARGAGERLAAEVWCPGDTDDLHKSNTWPAYDTTFMSDRTSLTPDTVRV